MTKSELRELIREQIKSLKEERNIRNLTTKEIIKIMVKHEEMDIEVIGSKYIISKELVKKGVLDHLYSIAYRNFERRAGGKDFVVRKFGFSMENLPFIRLSFMEDLPLRTFDTKRQAVQHMKSGRI